MDEWTVALRAERKSPATIQTYRESVTYYLRWCEANGLPEVLDRATVQRWLADILDRGASASTARTRANALRRFAKWLADEGEADRNALDGLKLPKVDETVKIPYTDDELRRLIAACSGSGDAFRDRRDEAIVRFMIETGARRAEVASLKLADVSIVDGIAVIYRGKGGKGRIVPFGPTTAQAIGRYIRVRRTHPRAATSPALWLGTRGREFRDDALYDTLEWRAERAGLDGFHPHRLRHTAAHRWLANGGSEHGLMAVAGWTTGDMLGRYSKALSGQRAVEEARRLDLGSL
jgi:site-specific recombinase XerD